MILPHSTTERGNVGVEIVAFPNFGQNYEDGLSVVSTSTNFKFGRNDAPDTK